MYLDHSIYRVIFARSLKFVGLCGKHASLVKPYIDTQYSTNLNMDFSMKWSEHLTFFILIQQLI